ncbi:SEC-C metal-binding domain-containing protein [Oceanirhabdus sp. W0125-5]|uniref:SEC-C metal-binding domain-containing protein n=1 Tax=Oceanirhabdus sp. W0125-5 TaxID=2999116 RepID=UPI0022F317FF|nr:SEC-C metal-binding domain-containing protein [Oceanirhabdus sp. W0125-5]WBW98521.1 SEC-C metal-binding domain-containing protein [Oceanirhabdus sp. W0125-5]
MDNIGREAQEMLGVLEEKQRVLLKKINIKVNKNLKFDELCDLTTREDMNNIAEVWGIGKCSKLKKKDYAEVIKKEIIDSIKNRLSKSDKNVLDVINYMVQNQGYVKIKELLNLSNEAIFYLKNIGVLFLGKEDNDSVAIIPKDTIETIRDIISDKDLIDKIQENEMILRAARGILYYVGILEVNALCEYLSKILEKDISIDNVKEIVIENEKIYHDIKFLSDLKEIEKYEFVASGKLSDPTRMLYAQNANNLDYKAFTKQQLLEAGHHNFSEWFNEHKSLYDYIVQNYGLSDIEGKMLVGAVINGLKDGSSIAETMEVLNSIFNFENNKERKEVEDIVIKVQGATRLWALRGHTPVEVDQMKAKTVVKDKKIGRNEICPCGSGKKYKKCCGVK